MLTKRNFPSLHPGEILEDFLKLMQPSQYHVSQAIGVPPRRMNEIVHGKWEMTADTALPAPAPSLWNGGALLDEPPGAV
jgi:plasmid maintenance system antidote protein VapI